MEGYTGRRITPDEVEAAYRETGMSPRRGCYAAVKDGKRCGCGMGAILVQSGVLDPAGVEQLELPAVLEALDIEDHYWRGFARGFDGKEFFASKSPGFAAGYADGAACAARVFARKDTP